MGQWCRETFIFPHTSEKNACLLGHYTPVTQSLVDILRQHKHANDYGSHITQFITCLWQSTETNLKQTHDFLLLGDGNTKWT